MPFIIRLIACTLLAFYAGRYAHADSTPDVLVFYSKHSQFQSALAEALQARLEQYRDSLHATYVTNDGITAIQSDSLIVSLGNHVQLDEKFRKLPNGVIYVHDTLPRLSTDRHNRFYLNVVIEQPPCRHLRLIKAINSHWENVGYLASNLKDVRLAQLKQCADELKLVIIDETIDDAHGVPDATDRLLRDSDVLLALPDSTIYNSHSVKNILLSAYRHRIPVIGFSDNFVRAGALAAVYSTPGQLADQLVTLILQNAGADGESASIAVRPEYYSISVNQQVAKSLDIPVKDESVLENSLREADAGK